jgi:hypothetical protein
MATNEQPRSDESATVRYLDLDHDGVPDAVERSQTLEFDSTGDGVSDVVDVLRETDAEIGIDGTPHRSDIHHEWAVRDRRSRFWRPKGAARGAASDAATNGALVGQRADGFAVVRLRPRAMRDGLQQLSKVMPDLDAVRISVAGRGVSLEPARPGVTWHTKVVLPTRLRRGSATSAVVTARELAAALERADSMHARGVPIVVRPDGIWIGDFEITVAEHDDHATPPPDLARRASTLARGVVVPRAQPQDGECTFAFRHGSVTTTGALLGALERAAIARVTVVEDHGLVHLVGRRRDRRGGPVVYVLGEATVRYA